MYLVCTVAHGQSYCKSEVAKLVQHAIDPYPFRSMPIRHPARGYNFLKEWPSKSKVKLGHNSRSHSRFNILSIHINFVQCHSPSPLRRYSFFKIWSLKIKVKVMGEVKVQSHKMGPTSYRLTPHSWDAAFQNLTFRFQRQGHAWSQSWKSQSVSFHHILSSYTAFSKLDLEYSRSMS